MVANFPSAQFCFQLRAEWVMTNDADCERRAGVAIRLGRPLDELREVVQKAEFDGVLRAILAHRKCRQTGIQDQRGHEGEKEKAAAGPVKWESMREIPWPTQSSVTALLKPFSGHWNRYPTFTRKFRPF